MKTLLVCLISFATITATEESFGQVTVRISDGYSAIHYSGIVQLKPRSVEAIDLPWNEFGDAYVVHVRANARGVSLLVLDGRDRAANNSTPRLLINSQIAGQQTFAVGKPPSTEGLILAVTNDGPTNVTVDILVHRNGKRPPEMRALIKDLVSAPIVKLARYYRLPKLTVTVQPCGAVNAYSMPNIVICTELISDLTDKGVPNALHPILLHEIAHSLLNVWGLPGYDNEDMADEFAAAFLATWSPEAMADFVRWFELQDSVGEAVAHLVNGSRHSLSIQRARNMRRAIEQPDALMSRWGGLLAPFARK